MYVQNFSTGPMEGLKNSVGTPILKKAGANPEISKNYRPVSNTLYLSKTIERVVLVQTNNHVELSDAHIPNQSGYKPRYSCESLLLRVSYDIFTNFENSKFTIAVLLHLTAAFDTVDHGRLLDVLWSQLGFKDNVFKEFEVFLRFSNKQKH